MGSKIIYFLTTIFILVSCGGGGGNSNNSNTSPGYGNNNYAPQITNSSANVSAVENQTSAFTVTASDADGDSLTFSISDLYFFMMKPFSFLSALMPSLILS